MRILFIGEYSRLHNSLKEGLTQLGHEVILVGNGDGFKNYPVDHSINAKWCETKWGTIPRKIIHKLFGFDIACWEYGIRFYFLLPRLKGFDVVQLINEKPIQTVPFLELALLKKLFKQNKNVFLLCCSVDYPVLQHMLAKKERYSIMDPYFEGNRNAKDEAAFMFSYGTRNHYKIHRFLYQKCKGIIATDLDYVNAIKDYPKYLGLIPNPINIDKLEYVANPVKDKVVIFLGINTFNYFTKGIVFFEKALAIIREKYQDSVTIIITQNVPYEVYIQGYNKAHILLDQVFAYDQGYNALEAMAKGKVVFTGAEKEFITHYNLTETVAINALPDVDYLVRQLSYLIENPMEIGKISDNARQFIIREHAQELITSEYLEKWKSAI